MTMLNVVSSMMCKSGLPKILWGDVLKTTNYICNRTLSTAVPTTPFELWRIEKPCLKHLCVWSCNASAKNYNPQAQKLDLKL